MGTLLTRTMFCQRCFDEHRPKKGNLFFVYGQTSRKFIVRRARRVGDRGMTPHFIELLKASDGIICYRHLCCMHDCGTIIQWEEERWAVIKMKPTQAFIDVKNWNAMVMYKRDPQFMI